MQTGIHAYIRGMPRPDNTLKRSGRVALELVKSSEIEQCYKRSGVSSHNQLYAQICLPPPRRARYQVYRDVQSIEFTPTDTYLLNIDAVIDDPDGQLTDERAQYTRRMEKLAKPAGHYNTLEKHITIMSVAPYVATSELLSFVESQAPDTLTLSAINMRPGSSHYNYF